MTFADIGSGVLSVRWLDVSTFETGYRIEAAPGTIDSGTGEYVFGEYRDVLDLPPNTASAVLDLDRASNAYAVRVYGTGPDGPDGLRSKTTYLFRSQGASYRTPDTPPFRAQTNAVALGPDPSRVSFVSPLGTVISFDALSGRSPATLGTARPPLKGGSGIVLAQTDGGTVGFLGAGRAVAFSNGSAEAAVSLTGGRVAFRDGETIRIETVPEAGTAPTLVSTFEVVGADGPLALSPDGEVVYVATRFRVRGFATDDGRQVFETGGGPVERLSVSADGKRIGISDGGIHIGVVSSNGDILGSQTVPRGGKFVVAKGPSRLAGVVVREWRVEIFDLIDGVLVERPGHLGVIRDGVPARIVDAEVRQIGSGRLQVVVATQLASGLDAVGHQWVVADAEIAAAVSETWVAVER